jgi:hypothetical protein
MSGDDDVVGGDIKTLVAFVISRVYEENTYGRPKCQFMSDFGGEIGIAGRTEHVQVLVWGGDTVEGDIGTGCTDRLAGKAVQQICGSVELFYPVASRNRRLKKQGVDHVINGVEKALGFIVLRRSV